MCLHEGGHFCEVKSILDDSCQGEASFYDEVEEQARGVKGSGYD